MMTVPLIEFEIWLVQCAHDARTKLCLTEIEIAFALIERAKAYLLNSLIESEEKYKDDKLV